MVRAGADIPAQFCREHTIKHGGKTFKVRMLPSGFLNESSEIMIGPGVVVDPNVLLGEIAEMQTGGRTYVDANCGIIEESHKVEDGAGRSTVYVESNSKRKDRQYGFWDRAS